MRARQYGHRVRFVAARLGPSDKSVFEVAWVNQRYGFTIPMLTKKLRRSEIHNAASGNLNLQVPQGTVKGFHLACDGCAKFVCHYPNEVFGVVAVHKL